MKFLKTSLLATVVIAAFAFTACNREDSASVDQSKIWINHNLTYDAATGITTASALFRFSNEFGTLLTLTAPAGVTMNGATPTFFSPTVTYTTTYTGVKDSVTFVYTNTANSTYTNTVKMIPSIDLPANINGTSISKSAATDIVFQGPALVSGETATVYIKEGSGNDWKAFVNTNIGATKVTLDIAQLSGLNTGPATIKIERYKAGIPANNPGKGGLTWVKYGSAVKNITITN